jgi:DNA relaxase NicK
LSDSHPTRFDYNADDITGLLSLPTIASHLREGGYKGYVCGEVIESVGGSNSGVSVYFGGRKSLQRVVFYDKAAESGDENAGIRHEVRCRGGRAVEMVELIRGKNYEEVCEILRGKLRGSISLGARRGKNLDRFVVAEFWKNWEDMLLSTPIEKQPLPRKSSITRSIAWIVKQVSKTVAKINTSIPCEYIDEFWLRIEKLGMDRIKDSDYGNIADYSREFSEDELWRMFPIC